MVSSPLRGTAPLNLRVCEAGSWLTIRGEGQDPRHRHALWLERGAETNGTIANPTPSRTATAKGCDRERLGSTGPEAFLLIESSSARHVASASREEYPHQGISRVSGASASSRRGKPLPRTYPSTCRRLGRPGPGGPRIVAESAAVSATFPLAAQSSVALHVASTTELNAVADIARLLRGARSYALPGNHQRRPAEHQMTQRRSSTCRSGSHTAWVVCRNVGQTNW